MISMCVFFFFHVLLFDRSSMNDGCVFAILFASPGLELSFSQYGSIMREARVSLPLVYLLPVR